MKSGTIMIGCMIVLLLWNNHFYGQEKRMEDRKQEWIESQADIKTKSTKCAYLTFDDGPSDETDAILDILKEEQVKASFFVVGKKGELAKQRYRRIIKEGHTLGIHSYSHDYKKIYASLTAFEMDIEQLENYLYQVTQIHPKYFRFPGGSSNTIVSNIKPYIQWIHEKGYEYYDWNALSQDAVDLRASVKTLNENIFHDIYGQETVIILMHDLSGSGNTAKALPDLIHRLKEQGYELKSISDDTKAIHHVE